MAQDNINKFVSLEIPPLEMYVGKDRITFTKKVVERLGKPDYVDYMYKEENNSFAVKACEEGEVTPFRFCYGRNTRKKSITTMSSYLLSYIREFMGEEWKNKRYIIRGKYDKTQNLVEFNLSKAINLNHELKNGRWVKKKPPKSAK